MTKPIRLQLSRRRGFNLQEASDAANGLPAVNVARPTRWGNPFKVGGLLTAAECVEAYSDMWDLALRRRSARLSLAELRGMNLACWCKSGAPCHADVLLELANGPACEEVRQ